ERGHLDVLRLRGRLEALDEIGKREADPRHHHRPGLDATEAVDALFERVRLQDVFDVEGAGDLGLAGDFDAPRARMQEACVLFRIGFLRAELVEIVVAGDLFVRVELRVDGILRIARVLEAAGSGRWRGDIRRLAPVGDSDHARGNGCRQNLAT